MSAQDKKSAKINLLPQEEFANSIFGRILVWLTSSFRIIVILTNLVVIVSFLSRFWLDSKRADLNDTIKVKKNVITASSNFEKEFRDVQKRLSVVSSMGKEAKTSEMFLMPIFSSVPQNLSLNTVNQSLTKIRVDANSLSERSISQYLVNLNSTGLYEKIELADVTSDPKNPDQLKFNLDITPKTNQK